MRIRTLSGAITLSLAFSILACNEQGDDLETADREVYFDGAEIKVLVEQDPNVTFFADVRDGTVNHFDQSEESIDFSNFTFQCPSMRTPVPMESILEHFDEEVYTAEYWSIGSMQSPEGETEFRKILCPIDCVCECPAPDDCVVICNY